MDLIELINSKIAADDFLVYHGHDEYNGLPTINIRGMLEFFLPVPHREIVAFNGVQVVGRVTTDAWEELLSSVPVGTYVSVYEREHRSSTGRHRFTKEEVPDPLNPDPKAPKHVIWKYKGYVGE